MLFLLNLIVGLLFLNEGLFHVDSVILAQAVEKTYKTHTLQPAIRGRYGSVILNSVLYLPSSFLKQKADFTVRFSSILLHSLSIVALFLFTKELFGDYIISFFSSLLLSFTPFYFSPNTYGKEHGASIFFFLLSLYLLLKGKNKNSPVLLGMGSLLIAFCVTIRESILVVMPLFFLLYFSPTISPRLFKIHFSKRLFRPRLLLAIILPFCIVFSFVWFTYLKSESYNAIFLRNYCSNEFLGIFSPMLSNAIQDLFLSLPAILIIPLAFCGAIKMAKEQNLFIPIFLFIWFLSILYFGNTSSYGPRYLDVVIIPIYIFAAYFLSRLYKKNKFISIAIVSYCMLSMLIFMYPMLSFRHRYNGEKEFALYVKEKTDPNAIIIAMDDGPFIEYYANRKFIGHPIGDRQKIDLLVKDIKERLNTNARVYLIDSAFSYDPKGLFRAAILSNFNLILIGRKLAEDYHRPELKFQTCQEGIYRLETKK